jgi:hypothetical protein
MACLSLRRGSMSRNSRHSNVVTKPSTMSAVSARLFEQTTDTAQRPHLYKPTAAAAAPNLPSTSMLAAAIHWTVFGHTRVQGGPCIPTLGVALLLLPVCLFCKRGPLQWAHPNHLLLQMLRAVAVMRWRGV